MFVAIVSNSYEVVSNRVQAKKSFSKYNVKKVWFKINDPLLTLSLTCVQPFKRLVRTIKAAYMRKPLYSETDLLRMLKNRSLLEKDVLTQQELEK